MQEIVWQIFNDGKISEESVQSRYPFLEKSQLFDRPGNESDRQKVSVTSRPSPRLIKSHLPNHWEVWRALKKLELPSATPRATLTHLSCSPNFPRASYLDERTRTYEPVVNYYVHLMSIVEISMVRKLIYLICFDILQSK